MGVDTIVARHFVDDAIAPEAVCPIKRPDPEERQAQASWRNGKKH